MRWLDEVIRDYGRSMGFPDLGFDEKGVVCLRFEKTGDLFIETSRDEVLVYLAREKRGTSQEELKKALEFCRPRDSGFFPVYAGLQETRLVFLTRIPLNEVSVPALEAAFNRLAHLHRRLG